MVNNTHKTENNGYSANIKLLNTSHSILFTRETNTLVCLSTELKTTKSGITIQSWIPEF